MSDIFNEVDEEVRREQLKKLWERYSIFIIGAAVLVVAGIGGWRGYEYWQAKKSAEAGGAFESAVVLSDQNKHAEAEAAFAKLAQDAPAGYRTLSKLRAANEIALRDPKEAVKAYDAIAADRSVGVPVQDAAAIRAGLLLLDTVAFDEMQRRLTPVSEAGRPFRHTARELLALSAWKAGDAAAARRFIGMVMADGETPAGTRARIDLLNSMIVASGKG